MNVVMVKHWNCEKIYWFEVPDHLVASIVPGIRVAYDTSRGKKYGIVVGSVVDADDVREVMYASGATLPLRKIITVAHDIPLKVIQIPDYMKRTKPSDDKIASAFSTVCREG